MDIIDRLNGDHRTLKQFLAVMNEEGASDVARRRSLSHFKRLYYAHSVAEEMVVYNALEGRMPQWNDLAHIGHAEHNVATELLTRLSEAGEEPAEDWDHDARLLEEIVCGHIDDEEAEMVPAVQEFFGSADRASMIDRYDRAKKIALTDLSEDPAAQTASASS
ncbi:hemerythrin domain-containing protein [Parasphingopyxis algicola]|uniref:hemerythrin domain-containing protein n=1 Tax=Parasphingopyxis algicola TaxID=2026624 RepID=UPI0015A12F6B|nr:hemerythrin domain-containing protein [Parasphingopyxis algicola]QLC23804.1 hemerythrin domain-containing protein [Parasphingopyxis algicola]